MKQKLLVNVKNQLIQNDLWKKEAKLLCAVSGGADSVALLLCLKQLKTEKSYQLFCCHIQHGLRGEASRKDEEFVYNLCTSLSIPLIIENADIDGDMHTPGIENTAREKRFILFEKIMTEIEADALLLAHHQDDQAETVLMRLIRGAGLKGLSGISPCREINDGKLLLRPFLKVSKKEILTFLQQEKISFCQDASNNEPITTRNLIRLELLPQMEKINPSAKAHMAAAAESLRMDEECLSLMAEQIYQKCLLKTPYFSALQLKKLMEAYPALQLRVVRKYYRDSLLESGILRDEKELSHQDTQNILSMLKQKPGSKINLPENMEMHRLNKILYLSKQGGEALQDIQTDPPRYFAPGETVLSTCGFSFSLQPAAKADKPSPTCVMIKKDLLPHLCLRTHNEGDMIHLLGAKGKKEMRRVFTDKKIDYPFRKILPMLAWEEKILWVPGICSSEILRYNGEDNCLKLTLLQPEKQMAYIIKE